MKKSLRLLCALLAAIMILSAIAIAPATAYDTSSAAAGEDLGPATDAGSTGDCTWYYWADAQTLRINGPEAMNGVTADYSSDDAPWYAYRNNIKKIECVGVRELNKCCFFELDKVEEVILPVSLTKIDDNAFDSMTSLTEITIPDNVKEIGDSAFYNCKKLSKVELNDVLEKIHSRAFLACEDLKEVFIPSSVTYIGVRAFGYTYNTDGNELAVDSFTIYGESTTEAQSYAGVCPKVTFEEKTPEKVRITVDPNGGYLTGIEYPDEVKDELKCFGTYHFHIDKGQKEQILPLVRWLHTPLDSQIVDYVEVNGTRCDEQYYTFDTPATLKYFWRDKTKKCKIRLDYGSLIDEEYVALLEVRGLIDADGIVTDEVLEGSDYNLAGFEILGKYPAGKTFAGAEVNGVYFDCKNYYYVDEDINVKYIWTDAPTSGTVADGSWSFDEATGTLTLSGTWSDSSYTDPAPWFPFAAVIKEIVIEDGVTAIGDYAFMKCDRVKSVKIPDSVKSIGVGAFYKCTSLVYAEIGSGVEEIGEQAFANTGLTSVLIPNRDTIINDSAFGFNIDLIFGTSKAVEGFKIYAEAGSKAADYAAANSIPTAAKEDYTVPEIPTDPTDPAASDPTTAPTTPSATTLAPTNATSATDPAAALKAPNTITVKAKKVTAKSGKKIVFKKYAKYVKISKAIGKLTFKKVKGNKKITVAKNGKLTIKKGLKKGKTYKIKIKISAAGNEAFEKATKTVTIKIKVK